MKAIYPILTIALPLLVGTASLAQEGPAPAQAATAAVDLACGDVSTLEAAHAAALVYYIAGYMDAQRDAGSPPPAASNDMVGGITLSAAAVIDACAADPTALVRDKIDVLGGTSAPRTATPAQDSAPDDSAPTEEAAPAEDTTAPPEETPGPTSP
jgi:hypothetical protein